MATLIIATVLYPRAIQVAPDTATLSAAVTERIFLVVMSPVLITMKTNNTTNNSVNATKTMDCPPSSRCSPRMRISMATSLTLSHLCLMGLLHLHKHGTVSMKLEDVTP